MSWTHCPTCTPALELGEDGRCRRCRSDVMHPDELERLAELGGVEPAILREMVQEGQVSHVQCQDCRASTRRIPLRGVPVDVCASCGTSFLSAESRQAIFGPEEGGLPAPAPVEEESPFEWDRLKLVAAPLAGIAVASVLAALLLNSPLFDARASGALLPTLAGPLTALVVAAVLGKEQRRIAFATVLFVLLACALFTWRNTASLALTGGALVVGFIASLLVLPPEQRVVSPRRVVLTLGVIALTVAGVKVGSSLRAANLADGCPEGATWSDERGRSCRLPDGRHHGPGLRASPTGKPLEEGTWIQGKRQGAFKVFDPEGGFVSGEGLFENDLREGPWLHFDASGEVVWSGSYRRDRKHGAWTDHRGGQRRIVRFKDGVRAD